MAAPASSDEGIVQECAAGLVAVRRLDRRATRSRPRRCVAPGPVEEELLQRISRGVSASSERRSSTPQWADNGPGWVARPARRAPRPCSLVRPGFVDLDIGVVGPHPPGSPEAFEVRAFFPKDGALVEDPVTGSLNASLAQWLLRTRPRPAPYVARQGTALGPRGPRAHHDGRRRARSGSGGGTVTCVAGTVEL